MHPPSEVLNCAPNKTSLSNKTLSMLTKENKRVSDDSKNEDGEVEDDEEDSERLRYPSRFHDTGNCGSRLQVYHHVGYWC